VPLAVAAVGPRALRLAGEVADIALLNYAAPPEYVAGAVERVHEAARAAGRTPGAVAIHGYVLLARTDLAGAERRIEVVRRTAAGILAMADQGPALAAPAGGVPLSWDDDALARFAVVGDAQACARRLAEYHAAGLECAVLLPAGMRDLHGTER
jgi:5,10-methylenetetrahydromethanopterin reductase